MRSGNKGRTNEELEVLLDKVMTLFRYIQAKDVFEAFYKKHLAKRLLLKKSASEDAEQAMISKIKDECGSSFTKKLEGMFRDMTLSSEIDEKYRKRVKELAEGPDMKTPSPIEMSVTILTTGNWPEYAPIDVKLPEDVLKIQDDFKEYYLGLYNGRKLQWHHTLSTAVLKAHFSQGRRELAVSAYQAATLLLFNEHKKLTALQIKNLTGLDENTVRNTLASLCNPQLKILNQDPKRKNNKIAPGDSFSVNSGFKHKLFRITISAMQMKETKTEQKDTSDRVFADRQYALDATIVRIMKARKTLSHQQLLSEVFSQLKFPTQASDIKRRIASLIEREYLERDEKERTVYNYLA